MESAYSLLDYVLSDDTLNNLIQTCSCLRTLKSLLKLKHQRILEGSCEKLYFSIDRIFNNDINFDLGSEILRTALLITADNSTHISQTTMYFLDKLHSSQISNEVYYAINLFNVILEHYKNELKIFTFIGEDFKRFQMGVSGVLKGLSKPLITSILVHIFPNYLCVCDKDSKNTFLTKMFEFVKKEKMLEVLCICYDQFIHIRLNNDDFNLLKYDDFWFLLTDCLVNKYHYVQKQAIYLLCKSIDIVLKDYNLPFLPQYLQPNDISEMEKTWRNYFILLDVSNEKQLHIVEPSLHMFSSVKNLDFLWRSCLYKIFLNHPQNVIVYNVAIFILQNETEWRNFSKIFMELLLAINKNEYNADSKKVFQEMGHFCNKLDNDRFNILLSESLTVPWVPAAIWSFYNNIFNQTTDFKIPVLLLEKVIQNLKVIPHKFIRVGCTRVILTYCTRNCSISCLNDLFKISVLLGNFDDICGETLFQNFIKRNDQIRSFSVELQKQFFDFVKNNESSERFTIVLRILQLLDIDFDFEIVLQSDKSDLGQLLLLKKYFETTVLENYLMGRFDLVETFEHVAVLLLFVENFCPQRLSAKASNILFEQSTAKYNDAQKILAFGIVCKNGIQMNELIEFYNYSLKKIDVKNEQIVSFFVKILINSFSDSCSLLEVEESISILENTLDSQNNVTMAVLENLTMILKHVKQNKVLRFIEKCFDEFLNLLKNNNTNRTTMQIFLSQICQTFLLENDDFCKLLVQYFEQLLDISNNANSVAYILSEKIAYVVDQKPEKGPLFVPIIVEFILRGIVINKHERVDYHVCQEIGRTLRTQRNPNLDEISTRLCAFESMLVLANQESQYHVTEKFVKKLVDRYMQNFSKRYFPDSQIHLEKLRILQTLMLLHKHLKEEKSRLIELLIESFLLETHQPSVKHLMQWLLISLIQNEHSYVRNIEEKLKTLDNNRPSTVCGLIPVLYHLIAPQEAYWDQLIELLLPYTMGAQFKLRIYSQVALVKLYEKALKTQNSQFLEKYKFLYTSLKQILEATANAHFDVTNIYHEFLDYFCLENRDCSTILYTIPKNNGVTEIEWENLLAATNRHNFKYVNFNHDDTHGNAQNRPSYAMSTRSSENIQKKITPWKDLLNNPEPSTHTTDFILVTSLVEKSANLGGLSRTCEVFGIKKMVMRTSKITSDKEFKSLSMSSENWVDIADVKVEDLQEFILGVKKDGYCVIGAEQTSESVMLDQFRFPKMTVLVLGNEKAGIPANLIPLLDKCIEIPQFGMVRSLNVHVAGAIVMWEYCKQQKL